jgi:hypothetical protein
MGPIKVNYEQKLFNGTPYGRFYSNNKFLCSQYQWNRIRATLFATTEYDIDIEACHPNILAQLHNKLFNNPQSTTNLSYYINNRDLVINDIMVSESAINRYNSANKDNKTKKDVVKSLFNIVVYGGTIETWKKTFKLRNGEFDVKNYYTPFYDEMKRISDDIISHDRFKILIDDVKAQFKIDKKNAKNSNMLSIILQNEEQIIISHAMNYFDSIRDNINFIITTYSYDGFQIMGPINDESRAIINGVLINLNYTIYNDLNYNIKFLIKPFREPLVLCPIDRVKLLICDYIDLCCSRTLADILLVYLDGNIVVVHGSPHWYDGVKWVQCDIQFIVGLVSKNIFELLKAELFNRVDESTYKTLCKFAGNKSNFYCAVNLLLADCQIDGLLFDDVPYLLNALNGTYNFRTNKLQEHNKKDYLTKIINFHIDESKISLESYLAFSSVVKTWFDGTDDADDVVKWFLQSISLCLNGENNNQKALILLGRLSRNGKSTFMTFLESVFANYYCVIPLAYFTENDKDPNGPKPFLLNCRSCRFCVVPEADTDNKNKIRPREFKTFTGKDVISVRDLYGGSNDIIKFKPQGTLIFISNDNLSFSNESSAISNRLFYINFCNWYGDESNPGWSLENKSCRKLNSEFIKVLYDLSIEFVHCLLYLSQQEIANTPHSQLVLHNECVSEVDTIRNWCDKYMIYDDSNFNNEVDSNVINMYPKIEGKSRTITLDTLFNLYSRDVETPVSQSNFNRQIINIYSNFYDPRKLTKLFGKQKKYIIDHRYIGYNNNDE